MDNEDAKGPMWKTFMALAVDVLHDNVKEEAVENMETKSPSPFSIGSHCETSSTISISPPPKHEFTLLDAASKNNTSTGSGHLHRPIPLPIKIYTVDNQTTPVPCKKTNRKLEHIKKEAGKKADYRSLVSRPSSRTDCLPDIDSSPYNVIELGAKFRNYDDFIRVLEVWKDTNYHPFRVASSDILRLEDGTTQEPIFKFRYIVFHCCHYGKPRQRGEGKRPNQSYLSCGCHAMLRVNYQSNENVFRITSLNSNHAGHPMTKDNYEKVNINRKKNGARKSDVKKNGNDKIAEIKERKAAKENAKSDLKRGIRKSGEQIINPLTNNNIVNNPINPGQEQLINLLKNISENINNPTISNPVPNKPINSNLVPNLYGYQHQLAILQNFNVMQANLAAQKPYLPSFMMSQGPQFGMPQWAYQGPPFNNFLLQQQQNFNLNQFSKLNQDGKP